MEVRSLSSQIRSQNPIEGKELSKVYTKPYNMTVIGQSCVLEKKFRMCDAFLTL